MPPKALLKNIQRYPLYLFFRDFHFWGPVFFLYFTSVLSLSQTLWLESIYYIGVATLEVPSGYLSDRFGRKQTLAISSLSMSAAYFFFFVGNTFIQFAIAQMFLAGGFAFASGTDTALHFETLKNVGREDEYAKREGIALRYSFLAGAIGALIGGGLAVYDLRWAYGASFLAALISLALILSMTEPEDVTMTPPVSMGRQVYSLLVKAWEKRFRSFSLYAVFMTVIVHFPYEFYQPYLGKVMHAIGGNVEMTPGMTGIHLAGSMLIGSWFTRFSGQIHNRCRIRLALLGCMFFQVFLTGIMALIVNPIVVLLLAGRSVSRAISTPIINAELSPLLKRSERGTYLSLLSLLGRVSYGIALFILPFSAALFHDSFHGTLVSATGIGIFLWAAVFITPFSTEASYPCCSNHTNQTSI